MTARKFGRSGVVFLRVLEGVLFAVAVIALCWYLAGLVTAAREQRALARELETGSAIHTTAASAAERPQRGSLVGRIEVPRLGLSALAREGVDPGTLRKAVGHVPASARPGATGNAAFAGHRDTFFRSLQHIRKGDDIVITTPSGRHRYVVSGIMIVKPTDVWVLDHTSEATMTLVTCHPFSYLGAAPNRFIVRASLVTEPSAALAGGQ